jgi:hypothetical protein
MAVRRERAARATRVPRQTQVRKQTTRTHDTAARHGMCGAGPTSSRHGNMPVDGKRTNERNARGTVRAEIAIRLLACTEPTCTTRRGNAPNACDTRDSGKRSPSRDVFLENAGRTRDARGNVDKTHRGLVIARSNVRDAWYRRTGRLDRTARHNERVRSSSKRRIHYGCVVRHSTLNARIARGQC